MHEATENMFDKLGGVQKRHNIVFNSLENYFVFHIIYKHFVNVLNIIISFLQAPKYLLIKKKSNSVFFLTCLMYRGHRAVK